MLELFELSANDATTDGSADGSAAWGLPLPHPPLLLSIGRISSAKGIGALTFLPYRSFSLFSPIDEVDNSCRCLLHAAVRHSTETRRILEEPVDTILASISHKE